MLTTSRGRRMPRPLRKDPGPVAERLHYGWVIVAALCITETITWGIIFYGFPVFLRALKQDLHASRIVVTGVFSAGWGVSAVAAIPVGRHPEERESVMATLHPLMPIGVTERDRTRIFGFRQRI